MGSGAGISALRCRLGSGLAAGRISFPKALIQILIDSSGKPCLLSANNQTNIKSEKLNLQYAINTTSNWTPAISENKAAQSSVSLIFDFDNGNFTVKRRVFDFTNATNEKSIGTPEMKGTNRNRLSETWTVYTQQNSELPWDMTRAVVNDLVSRAYLHQDVLPTADPAALMDRRSSAAPAVPAHLPPPRL